VNDLTISPNQNLQIGAYWGNDDISLTVNNLTILGNVGTQNWWFSNYNMFLNYGRYYTWWWNNYYYSSDSIIDWSAWQNTVDLNNPHWRWQWLRPYYSEYGNKLVVTDSLTIENGGQLWGGDGLMLEIKPGATINHTYNGVKVNWFEAGHSYIYIGNGDAGAWVEIPATEPEDEPGTDPKPEEPGDNEPGEDIPGDNPPNSGDGGSSSGGGAEVTPDTGDGSNAGGGPGDLIEPEEAGGAV
jgi:hypothetical protein